MATRILSGVAATATAGSAAPAAARWGSVQGPNPYPPTSGPSFGAPSSSTALDRPLDRRERESQGERWRVQQERQHERERRDWQAREHATRRRDAGPAAGAAARTRPLSAPGGTTP